MLFFFFLFILFPVCATETERDRGVEAAGLPCSSLFQRVSGSGNRVCMDDVFLPLRRGQISEEHYRCLIMNDRLIKLI